MPRQKFQNEEKALPHNSREARDLLHLQVPERARPTCAE